MTTKFNIGDDVIIAYNEMFDHYTEGKILAISSKLPLHIVVELDSGQVVTYAENYVYLKADKIGLIEQAKAKQLQLEQEFAMVKQNIDLKLEEATKLIEEASNLAIDHGKTLYHTFHYAVGNIADTLGIDWNSSSINC